MQETLVHDHKRAFNDVCNSVIGRNKWNTESDVEGDVYSGSVMIIIWYFWYALWLYIQTLPHIIMLNILLYHNSYCIM